MDDGPYDVDMADSSIWNDAVQYENTNNDSGKKSECDTQKDEESHYETLHLEDLDKPKRKTEIQDKSLRRLKCVIYILIVLIIVLYVTLISMIMIMFLPKDTVDGQWADWSSWTSCDVTCGNGTYLRTRTCLNPVHKNKGSDCVGENLQSSDCLKESCPVDGRWTQWSSWTSCDVTCGKGSQLRTRRCTNPAPEHNGKDCVGESLQSGQCSRGNCTVDGRWTQWSSWTSCDVTCGSGSKLRTRRCTNPAPEHKGKDCIGDSLQSSQCSRGNCSVDGRWTQWSSWTSCDVTCGIGSQLRTRRCTNPAPEHNGKDCIGDSLQSSQCSRGKCKAIMSAFSVKGPHTFNTNDSKLNFTSTIYQYGNDFTISNGTYRCSIPGVYHFSTTLVKRNASQIHMVYCRLFKNYKPLIEIRVNPSDEDIHEGNAAVSQSVIIDLDIGDTVYIGKCIGQPKDYLEEWSSFTGFLLFHNN